MKKLLSVMAVGLFALVFASCGGVDQKDPKAVAKAAVEALKSGDAKAMIDLAYFKDEAAKEEAKKELDSEETKKQMETMKEALKDITFEVGEVKEDGDKATATIKVKNGDKEAEVSMKLQKSGDDWKVNFEDFDMLGS